MTDFNFKDMTTRDLETKVDKTLKETGLTIVELIKKVYEADYDSGFNLETYYDVDVKWKMGTDGYAYEIKETCEYCDDGCYECGVDLESFK